jgi:glutathionyl-hydroquinone reductase
MRAVSNESSSIVRNLGQLQLPGSHGVDLYPQQLQVQIDQLNEQVSCTWGFGTCCVLNLGG